MKSYPKQALINQMVSRYGATLTGQGLYTALGFKMNDANAFTAMPSLPQGPACQHSGLDKAHIQLPVCSGTTQGRRVNHAASSRKCVINHLCLACLA